MHSTVVFSGLTGFVCFIISCKNTTVTKIVTRTNWFFSCLSFAIVNYYCVQILAKDFRDWHYINTQIRYFVWWLACSIIFQNCFGMVGIVFIWGSPWLSVKIWNLWCRMAFFLQNSIKKMKHSGIFRLERVCLVSKRKDWKANK